MMIGLSPHIKISYRADMQMIIIRWQQPVTFTEFKLNCLAVLEMARENTSNSWLFDCRSKGEITDAESEWLCHDFFPKVLQQVAPQFLLAWLLNPRQMQGLKEGKILSALTETDPDIRRSTFMTEQEAVKWLEHSLDDLVYKRRP